MKKLAAIGLALIMTAGLCIGCGSKEAPQASDPAPEAAVKDTEKPAGEDAATNADAKDCLLYTSWPTPGCFTRRLSSSTSWCIFSPRWLPAMVPLWGRRH